MVNFSHQNKYLQKLQLLMIALLFIIGFGFFNKASADAYDFPPIWDEPVNTGDIHGIIIPAGDIIEGNSLSGVNANPRICDSLGSCFSLQPGDWIGGFYGNDLTNPYTEITEYKYGGGDFWEGTDQDNCPNLTCNIIFPLFRDNTSGTPSVKDGFGYAEPIQFRIFSWQTKKEYIIDTISFDTLNYPTSNKWYPLGLSAITNMVANIPNSSFDAYATITSPLSGKVCLQGNPTVTFQGNVKSEITNTPGVTYHWFINSSEQVGSTFTTDIIQNVTDGLGKFFLKALDGNSRVSPEPQTQPVQDKTPLFFDVYEPPTANAGSDGEICINNGYQLNGTAGGDHGDISWSSNKAGNYDNSATEDPIYTPTVSGSHTLTMTVQPYVAGVCLADDDDLTLTVDPLSTIDTGVDQTICTTPTTNTTINLSNVTASNYSSVVWATNKNGTFNNANTLNPIYTLGTEDVSNKNVTLTATVSSSYCPNVSDSVIYSYTSPPTVNAPTSRTICENQTTTLSSSATNYNTIAWTTSGDGSFSSLNTLSTIYTPGTNDKLNGTVTTTVTASSNACLSSPATKNTVITVRKIPIVSAGVDVNYSGSPVYLSEASASNYGSLTWTSSGTGSFSNRYILKPTYTPSVADIQSGSVTLTLLGTAVSPCNTNDTDTMVISFNSNSYSFSGPSSGNVNTASQNFTITPASLYTGDITITPTVGFGLSPIIKTFSNSSTPQTFTITPTSAGTITLVPTSNPALTNPSNLTYIVNEVDTTPPSVHEETAVITPTNNTNPSYSFHTNEAGDITYSGGCTSNISYASVGINTISFNTLENGTYSNCKIRVTDGAGNQSDLLSVTSFTIDITAPTIAQVVPVTTPTTDTTPNYTFSSTEAGTIDYSGSCSSLDTTAIIGDNEITFEELGEGTYSDCKITVIDSAGNISNELSVNTFTINTDNTAPTVLEVTVVPPLGNDRTPNYTFSTSENGTISYPGSCSSSQTSALIGNNIITFNSLGDGTYADCKVRVTDIAGNSSTLTVTSFTIDATAPVVSQTTPVTVLGNDPTPNYTFSSTEAGDATYSGGCTAETNFPNASSGGNTITFDTLADGVYSSCKIRVTDQAGNLSNLLSVSAFTIDTTSPVLSEYTNVPTPSTDTTPDYTFYSTEAGTITYGGSCDSSSTVAIVGHNLITFDELVPGTYSNCTIVVRDGAGNDSLTLSVDPFTIEADLVAPIINQTTPVPVIVNDITPDYTFYSTEAGYILYGGSCNAQNYQIASVGNNTITFDALGEGTYSNCTITVIDVAGNESNLLAINEFTVLIPDSVVPTSVSATANSKTEIILSWVNNSANIEYYAENITKGTNSGWISDTSFSSTGLNCETNYSFKVKARNQLNEESAYSNIVIASTNSCDNGGGGGGGGGGNPTPLTPVYCPAGVLFDSVTGKKCTAVTSTTNDCPPGVLFNPLTGAKCSTTPTTNPVYCPVGFLFDSVTGKPCTTYTQIPSTVLLTKTLKLGTTDNEVKLLQVYLNTHGYIVATTGNGSIGKESTYFGQITKNAVIKFQKANGLIQDGIVGKKSRDIINEINPIPSVITYPTIPIIPTTPTNSLLTKTLRLGMTDPEVKTLQIYLNTHGFEIVSATGFGTPGKESMYFGERTKDAVIKFQKANGLIQDGVCGAKCREKINQNL